MSEPPAWQDEVIQDMLWQEYGLKIEKIEPLSVGADFYAFKYRLITKESISYFLKLRQGDIEEISFRIPHFLSQQGLHQVISPIETKQQALWTSLDDYACILYPFIEGQDGFQVELSADQWREFGAALSSVHSLALPPVLREQVPVESFSPYWRDIVKEYLAQADTHIYTDPVAGQLVEGLKTHQEEIYWILERSEQLGSTLQSQSLERVLCHTDIHAGNLLITPKGDLYMIDWDQPMLAPRERDLMFIGGGIGGIWNTTRESELFYQGYGFQEINQIALAYYRYERILEDIAAFCEQILLSTVGSTDRETNLGYFNNQFWPGHVVDMAYQTDPEAR